MAALSKHVTKRYTKNFYHGYAVALVVEDDLFKEIVIYLGKELHIPSYMYADFMQTIEELHKAWRDEYPPSDD